MLPAWRKRVIRIRGLGVSVIMSGCVVIRRRRCWIKVSLYGWSLIIATRVHWSTPWHQHVLRFELEGVTTSIFISALCSPLIPKAWQRRWGHNRVEKTFFPLLLFTTRKERFTTQHNSRTALFYKKVILRISQTVSYSAPRGEFGSFSCHPSPA